VNRWQAANERRNELIVEFRRGKVIEMGPSVDDYDPEPGVDAVCTPEHPCPKSLDPVGVSWAQGCWCYRNGTNPTMEARREWIKRFVDRVMADNAEVFRRLALGPGVEDMGQRITDEINADPEEVERLRQARISARQGDTVPLREALADDDADAMMLKQARAAYAAAGPDDWITYTEEDLEALRQSDDTEPPAAGAGWCAPSP
jgi:hypothetical protein